MQPNKIATLPKTTRTHLSNYSLKFSPHEQNKLAMASAQYFGVVGKGGVLLLQLNEVDLQVVREFETPDACFDVCFNEGNPNQLLSAHGDGALRLWDLLQQAPLAVFKEHAGEVFSVEWSHINKRKILSASYDRCVKVWDAQNPAAAELTFNHDFVVYAACWHPTHESILASCSGDQTARIWDTRSGRDVKKIHAHNNEVLSVDFNKYENFIATGSTDNSIKLWDLRSTGDMPIMTLTGHQLACRRVKFSPYHANILASASYDMSVMIWDLNTQQCINRFDHHTEFVVGLDFNLFVEKQLAACSWDKGVSVFRYDDNPRAIALPPPMKKPGYK